MNDEGPVRTRTTPLPPPFPGRENLVRILDENSAPRIIPYGDGWLQERLPAGTRVIYPPAPLPALADPARAMRRALQHPMESEPLYARMRPGMKLTIAIDDLSMPLPAMRSPDARQIALDAILEIAAARGVEDIRIIVAIALHRRMTPAELEHIVGPTVFAAYHPERLVQFDAEDPSSITVLGHTDQGEEVTLDRRAAESDLLVYVSIPFAPMSGGYKSAAVGLTGYAGMRAHHTPGAIARSMSYMDPEASELGSRIERIGRLVHEKVPIFQIELTLNNDLFGPALSFLARDEDTWRPSERLAFSALRATSDAMPPQTRRSLLHQYRAPYGITSVQAGATAPVHRAALDATFRQLAVPVQGQSDVLLLGVTFVGPYNVNSTMNPLLVHCTALGYMFNLFRGAPLVKKGGVILVCHPLEDDFRADHHPSYVPFFRKVLPQTRDSRTLRHEHEESYAKDPAFIHAYRHGNAYHGVHPFYMWYWGENGRRHAGKVISIAPKVSHTAETLGWDVAQTVSEGLERARAFLGREPTLTYLRAPPMLIADVTP